MCAHQVFSAKRDRNEIQEMIYTQGCLVIITKWFRDHMIIMGIAAFSVAGIQIVSMMFTLKLIQDIRRKRESRGKTSSFHQPLYINDM